MLQPDELGIRDWRVQSEAAVGYAAATKVTAPLDCVGAKRVRISAIDGALLLRIGTENNQPAAPGTGCLRIIQGTETFYLPKTSDGERIVLHLAPVTGTVNASIQWGL